MIPSLHAIAGPLKGTATELSEEELTIGRKRSNQLAIPDLNLSRHHCAVRKEGNDYKVLDLNSRNGIFVNSIPVRERILEHGDQLQIGSSIFVFVSEADSSIESAIADGSLTAGSMLTTKWDQNRQSNHDSKELDILLKISSSIHSIQSVETLGRTLLELLFEVIPSQRGALLLLDPHSNELTKVSQFANPTDSPPVRISRSITDQVLQEKESVLAKDVQQDGVLISSMISVPLVDFRRMLGILYFDTLDPTTLFHENHLRLASAVANICAPVIQNCLDLEQWKERSKRLQTELQMDRPIIGESSAMKKVLQMIQKISAADSTVLIYGETGTGKELAARAIHANSRRAEAPFVAINCAALPEMLLESELFGYEKGAFTGAFAQKKGKVEIAAGGTLFLDEIAEMVPAIQAKLLRFLQEREFERVGGTRTIKVDLRVIVATNRDLAKEVAAGKFRQDLYYRLNVVLLETPPLRDLDDDILLLANYFVSRLSQKLERRVHGISHAAQQCLVQYEWPGNVRELENVLERAILLGSTDEILPEDLPDSILSLKSPEKEGATAFHESVNEHKKKLIKKALEAAGQDFHLAADNLGIHFTHLYRLVRSLKLDITEKK